MTTTPSIDHLRLSTFTVQGAPGEDDDRAAEFIRAMDFGFLETQRSAAEEIIQLDRFRVDGTTLTAVYDDEQDERALARTRPVATFGDFVGTVALRTAAVIPAQMVTEVSVRSTHRRRGILSTMMRTRLQHAKDSGIAVSALTASEGGIYGRFGFGAAAYSQRVTVRVPAGLRLRDEASAAIAAAGVRVIVPTWQAFGEAYPELQRRVQTVTPGQIGATHAYRRRAFGDENPWAMEAYREHNLRPLLAIDAVGEPVGYAITTPLTQQDAEPLALRVVDLGAVDVTAELALWAAMAATDLVAELRWKEAPLDFALPWALVDARDVVFGARADHLWLRVLDMRGAWEVRGLLRDGTAILEVDDRLGFAAGRWVLTCEDGTTSVRADPDGAVHAPTLRLGAEAVGSLLTGAVAVRALIGAGRASADPADVIALSALFDDVRAPRNAYTF